MSDKQHVSFVPRLRLRYCRQVSFNARHTCSNVTSGFFPPKPHCVQRDKCQGHQAQRQMSFQRYVTSAFEMCQPDFALRDPEHVLHVPTRECHLQQPSQARSPSRSGDEVFDLTGFAISSTDQQVSRPPLLSPTHRHGLGLPHGRRAGLLLDPKTAWPSNSLAGPRKHGLGANLPQASSLLQC